MEYDKNLVIKLYLNGEIINSNLNSTESNKIETNTDLNYTKLFTYFKDLLNIESKLFSSVFQIKDIDQNSEYYKLLNYGDFKEYIIQKNQ